MDLEKQIELKKKELAALEACKLATDEIHRLQKEIASIFTKKEEEPTQEELFKDLINICDSYKINILYPQDSYEVTVSKMNLEDFYYIYSKLDFFYKNRINSVNTVI